MRCPSSLARTFALAAAVLALGCGGATTQSAGGTGGGGSGGQGTGGQTTTSETTGGSGGASTGGGDLGGFGGQGTGMTPVRAIPGLTSITFYERTGGTEPTAYEFAVNGPELTTRLDDPLGPEANGFDISGASTEYYDVYYSDEQGVFDIDGSYLTISGVFLLELPAGGGLNLAEIALNYADTMPEYGNYLASYVALGDNKNEATVGNCIDGDLQSHTTMGNTVGAAERLRLTLGFSSSSGEPK